uniref:Uncharacterized protein n=1 Tax=Arundo donax TaxID=35708 RepID=A0A0A9EDD8_ARUDO
MQGKPCNHPTLIHMVTCMLQQCEILPFLHRSVQLGYANVYENKETLIIITMCVRRFCSWYTCKVCSFS